MAHNPNFPVDLNIQPSDPPAQTWLDSNSSQFGISAQQDAIETFGIAGRVWEAAYTMNSYIDNPAHWLFDPPFFNPDESSRPLTILELGSGTGVVAAHCAPRLTHQGHTLVVTDLPEVCPLLQRNLQQYLAESHHRPSAPKVLVRPLSWGNNEHACNIAAELGYCSHDAASSACYLTHVICSDLVYFPELLAPLLRTLLQITGPPFISPIGHDYWPRVIVSYKIRSLSKESSFWSTFGLWFSFEPVLVRKQHQSQLEFHQDTSNSWTRLGSSDGSDIFIFIARRKPESLTWEIPSSDEELLGGVGARGSRTRKGDDTFEGLLLMGLGTVE